ncbi:MAG: NUDIX domain-containing protein [Gammaproteobacteria bacterium]
MSTRSAGILLFRRKRGCVEVLLGHPGGPFWTHKDTGAWSIPKGLCQEGETPLTAAKREFREETGFSAEGALIELGALRQPSGKIVHAWALEKDVDAKRMVSNSFRLEWPPHSGSWESYPELDRVEWFDLTAAQSRISKGQKGFLDRLEASLQRAGR